MPPSLSVKRESPVFSAMDELETFSSVLQDHEKVKTEQDGTREESDDNQQALLPLVNLHLPSQVFFNFLYSNNSLQQTECREALVCPWCDISCVRIYSLLKHMTLCHPHFHFTYTVSGGEGRERGRGEGRGLGQGGERRGEKREGERRGKRKRNEWERGERFICTNLHRSKICACMNSISLTLMGSVS